MADLLILSTIPLDDLRNQNSIEEVILDNRFYDYDTLDEFIPASVSSGTVVVMGYEPEGESVRAP